MRSMQECKEEIFRRGAEKIRKKKQRKKIATGVGMSFCLCLLILAGFRGGLSVEKAREPEAATTECAAMEQWTEALLPTEAVPTEDAGGSDLWDGNSEEPFGPAGSILTGDTIARPTPKAYIFGMGDCVGYYEELEDPAVIPDLLTYLQSLTEAGRDDLTEEQSTAGNYFIEISDDEGETWEFTLKDRLLENSNTGNWVILTQEQVSELLSRMGVE